MLEDWGETITNINPRQYAIRSDGEFFFVASDFAGSLPEGAVRIELRSRKAKLLARAELANDALICVELFELADELLAGVPDV